MPTICTIANIPATCFSCSADKIPLRPDDEFISRLALTKEGIKYVFHHDLYRAADNQLCFRGKVELVCLVDGRLANSPDYDAAFAPYILTDHE